MASSGMLRRVALVRTDVSEELIASIIRVIRIGEIGTLAIDDGGAMFLKNVGYYKSNTA
jgi:demethoxyubiquinone hydroxylase (CLK1/Coq7/Cat5 family)